MKIAPLYRALASESNLFSPVLIHTGQHYDPEMSDRFLEDFSVPKPAISLGIGSGTHAEQTGNVMIAYEKICMEQRPDLLIVVGDVNSTIACTLAAKKLLIPVAHLEAGLRSGDRTMPEELNRVLTDSIADKLWTPSPDGDENLLKEGIPATAIKRVGNIMLDSFELVRKKIVSTKLFNKQGLDTGTFGVVTLHRPFNVDEEEGLAKIVELLIDLTKKDPIVFPVHPRTKKRLEETGLWQKLSAVEEIYLLPPLGYIDFMSYVTAARYILTDSGGLQEETTYLGIPCFTMRPSTERPITITQGTNRLVTIDNVRDMLSNTLSGKPASLPKPEYWDGQTARRIVEDIKATWL